MWVDVVFHNCYSILELVVITWSSFSCSFLPILIVSLMFVGIFNVYVLIFRFFIYFICKIKINMNLPHDSHYNDFNLNIKANTSLQFILSNTLKILPYNFCFVTHKFNPRWFTYRENYNHNKQYSLLRQQIDFTLKYLKRYKNNNKRKLRGKRQNTFQAIAYLVYTSYWTTIAKVSLSDFL